MSVTVLRGCFLISRDHGSRRRGQVARRELRFTEKQSVLKRNGTRRAGVARGEVGRLAQGVDSLAVAVLDKERAPVVPYGGSHRSGVARQRALMLERTLQLRFGFLDAPGAQIERADVAENDLRIQLVAHADGAVD